MKLNRVFLLAGVLVLSACKQGADSKAAADTAAPAKTPPVAVVNGTEISRDTYEFFVKNIANGKSSSDLTDEQRKQVLDELVNFELLAQHAVKSGEDKDKDTAAAIELSRLNVLRQAATMKYIKGNQPTEQDLRTEFDALPKVEYRARHILVQSEESAQKIIERLNKGEKFADVAKKESIDPTAKQNGGDLDWFTPDSMVKPFVDGVVSLKDGELAARPVKSQFGWHIIQRQGVRDFPRDFEQEKERLTQTILARKFKAFQDDLLKTAKVEKKL